MESNFIREYHNALSEEQCQELITVFEETIKQDGVYIGNGAKENGGGSNRSDISLHLQKFAPDANGLVMQAVKGCWESYILEFPFLQNHKVISYSSKMQKTPPGGGFHVWHWEHNADHMHRDRMAVWTLYLTDHEDEGETEFLAHGWRVKPEIGKFCIFPADYTGVHRGNPVYSKDKYIVTGWYEYHNG